MKKVKLQPPWKPGESGNRAGRPLGSRTKLSEKFISAMHDDFMEYGASVIRIVRVDRPEVYLKIIAQLVPREMHFKSANAFQGMTNEQVDEIVAAIGREIASRSPSGGEAGSDTPSSDKLLN